MIIRAILTLTMALFLLVGCGSSTDEEEENVREDTVFDPLLETMDKAEKASATVEDRVNQMNKQLEDQEEEDEE